MRSLLEYEATCRGRLGIKGSSGARLSVKNSAVSVNLAEAVLDPKTKMGEKGSRK